MPGSPRDREHLQLILSRTEKVSRRDMSDVPFNLSQNGEKSGPKWFAP